MKPLKIVITALLLIVLALLAVGGYLIATFDPNEHKDKIITTVKQQTGRNLAIDGNIELSVFPWLGIRINNVALGNPPGLADNLSADNFATIGQANVHLKLMPLLKRQLEVDTVTLQNLQLTLLTDRLGANNWTFATTKSPAGTPTTPAPADNRATTQALAGLSVGGIDIRDANIDWRDLGTATQISLHKLSLTTGPLALGREIPVKLSFTASGIAARDIPFSLSARIKANAALDRFDVKDMKLNSNELNIEANADARLTNGQPQVAGQLTLSPFNPRRVMAAFGISDIATTGKKALQQASAQLKFRATEKQFSIDDLKLQLDDSTIRGESDIRLAAIPHIGFSITLDRINLDDYLPPTAPATTSTPATPAAASTAAVIALPVDTLRQLDVSGEAKIGKLTVTNLNVSNVSAVINARNGLIRLEPLGAELYGGRYSGDIRLDVRPQAPHYAARESLHGVRIEPLLKDLLDNDLLTGQGDLDFDLNSNGVSVQQLTERLNGSAQIQLKDGALKGINIADMIRQAQAKLGGKPVPAATTRETDFTAMKASITIKNGVAHNNDLDARAPYLRIGGQGTANLVTQKLDYHLTARVVDTEAGQGGADLGDLKGADIPIRISGSFGAPDIQLDSAVIRNQLKAQAKKQLKKEAEKEKAKLKQKTEEEKERLKREAEEKLRDKLKSLF